MTYPERACGIALLITSALLVQSSFSKERVDVAPPALQTSAQSSCNRDRFRIILDVGHTAEEPGAMSAPLAKLASSATVLRRSNTVTS